MILIDQLFKDYKGKTVVNGLSFTVPDGTITGFLGPNGAGKTTTLKAIVGLIKPTRGQVLVDGKPFRSCKRPAQTIGLLLEPNSAHRARSGRNHLLWMAQSNGIPPQRIDEVLELTGMSTAAGQKVGSYSLGMRQRLGIAGALLGDPQHLILDEPVNGLDAEGIVWLRTLLRDLADSGKGILISSHLMGEVSQVADNLVVIGAGGLRGQGSLQEITAGHQDLESAYFALTTGHEQFAAGGSLRGGGK